MKILIVIIILLGNVIVSSMPNFNTDASDLRGEVIWVGENCDFYIIETNQFFVLVELYSGLMYKYDILEGELHSYNFKYLMNKTRGDRKVKVRIENYWQSKENCIEWLKEHDKCDLK